MTTYWQVAAGAQQRDYTAEFIRYGIAFVGGETQRKAMAQVQVGDCVMLKRGRSKMVAAGLVVERDGRHKFDPKISDKQWLLDVDGWELPYWCYVDWHRPRSTAQGKVQGFTRATMQRVRKRQLIDRAKELLRRPRETPQAEPQLPARVTDAEILRALRASGLRVAESKLRRTIRHVQKLATDYYETGDRRDSNWEHVREHETRTFLIVPLMLALGWPEQSIKIELPVPGSRDRVDLALFDKDFRESEPCDATVLIETKGFAQGLFYAPEQARGYATQFPRCRVVVVTNGHCYKLYARNNRGFTELPSAYLNVREPRATHPLDPSIGGASEALRLMLPPRLITKR